MADDAVRTLVCLIEGDSTWFKVKPTGSMDIVDLRELIWEEGKNSVLRGVDAKDLTLWKVRMTMASDSTTKSSAG
jgi:Crinkler effector protein N-terminal domain